MGRLYIEEICCLSQGQISSTEIDEIAATFAVMGSVTGYGAGMAAIIAGVVVSSTGGIIVAGMAAGAIIGWGGFELACWLYNWSPEDVYLTVDGRRTFPPHPDYDFYDWPTYQMTPGDIAKIQEYVDFSGNVVKIGIWDEDLFWDDEFVELEFDRTKTALGETHTITHINGDAGFTIKFRLE